MVTHSSTSRPVQCLCMAERTGCPVLTDLWSYVLVFSCVLTRYRRLVVEISSQVDLLFTLAYDRRAWLTVRSRGKVCQCPCVLLAQ